jgi:hypothetical protein
VNGVESPYIDAENETVHHPTSVDGPSQQRLSARCTPSLREEAVADDGTPREWRAVRNHFEDYVMRQNAADETLGEQEFNCQSHRFTPEYANEKYGKIHSGFRHVSEETTDALTVTTILITLTGWPFDGRGRPAPPIDFFEALNEGRKTTLRRIRNDLRALDGFCDWGYVTTREPHTGEHRHDVNARRKGYPHTHVGIAVVTKTETPIQTIHDVCRDALNNVYLDSERGNPFARLDDHGDEAVSVMRQGRHGDVCEQLAGELTNHLIGYEFNFSATSDKNTVHDVPEPTRRFASLMWARGTPTVSLHGGSFGKWIARTQTTPDTGENEMYMSDSFSGPRNGGGGPTTVEPSTVAVEYSYPDEESV